MQEKPIDIYFLLGPTASGKSGLGLHLAGLIQAEILSVDSMQVYKGMDIGTAKPSPQEVAKIPHHLIDLIEPSESFSVAKFVELGAQAISDINRRGKRILAVGGTALYAKALAEGLFDGPGSNAQLRAELKDRAKRLGSVVLHEELAQVDPLAAERIHRNDLRRIVRALEVFELTGQPISTFQQQFGQPNPKYNCRFICLHRDKADLNHRINARVKDMIKSGLVQEVSHLLNRPGGMSAQAKQALGYQEIIAHLAGQMSLEDAIEAIKIHTRQFAKRQRTWFRRFEEVISLDVGPDAKYQDLALRTKEAFLL